MPRLRMRVVVLVALGASVVLLYGMANIDARDDPSPATTTSMRAIGTATPPLNRDAQTENVGSEAIRPTLVGPPNQPAYTVEDVIDYVVAAGKLERAGSGPPTTIEDITFMSADAAGQLFNTPVPRPGEFPVCVVSLRGEFHFSVPNGAGSGVSSEQSIIFDGITGNMLIAIGGRGV